MKSITTIKGLEVKNTDKEFLSLGEKIAMNSLRKLNILV
jgi:hypothetical protein